MGIPYVTTIRYHGWVMKQQVKNIGPVSWRAFRRIGIYGAEALTAHGGSIGVCLGRRKRPVVE